MARTRQWLTRHPLTVTTVLVAILILGWCFLAYPRGVIVAWVDYTRGHYEVQTFGYPAPWAWEFRRLIQERYGVEVKAVAGCVVSPQLVWYVHGYNSVSCSRLRKKFGKDILAECVKEAQAAWQSEHPRD